MNNDFINNETNQSVGEADLDVTEGLSKGAQASKKFAIGGVLLPIVIFAIFCFLIVLAVLVTYDKIELPNKKFQRSVASFVTSLPFMPENKSYVVSKALSKQNGVDIYSYTTNISIDRFDRVDDKHLGLFPTLLNTKIIGKMDFSKADNVNLISDLDIKNVLNADVLMKNSILYFRVKNLAPQVQSYLEAIGVDLDQLRGQWFKIDSLDYAIDNKLYFALNNVSSGIAYRSRGGSVAEYLLGKLSGNNALMSKSSLKYDQIDGKRLYVLDIDLNKDDIHEMLIEDYRSSGNNSDDVLNDELEWFPIENAHIRLYINQQTFVVDKIEENLDVNVSKFFLINSTDDNSVVVKIESVLSDFGNGFNVDSPTDYVDFGKWMDQQLLNESKPKKEPMPADSGINGFSGGFSYTEK